MVQKTKTGRDGWTANRPVSLSLKSIEAGIDGRGISAGSSQTHIKSGRVTPFHGVAESPTGMDCSRDKKYQQI